MTHPYNILGIGKNASADDIKSAYRKLAKKYHPDRNPDDPTAEKKFKEVQSAYQILGDPEKKRQHDNPAPRFEGTSGARGFADIFSEMFGGRDPFAGFHEQRRHAVRHSQQRLVLTFEEAAFGCEKPISRNYRKKCGGCDGIGAAPGTGLVSCNTCRGSGEITVHRGFINIKQACGACNGHGKIIKERCLVCHGDGSIIDFDDLRVSVPAGINTGHRIRLEGKGDENPAGRRGDLFLEIQVKDSPLFAREDNNIKSELRLDYPTYALGGVVNVPSLRGERSIKIPAGTEVDSVLRLKGEGINDVHGGPAGDHFIRLVISVPTKLTDHQKSLLEAYRDSI